MKIRLGKEEKEEEVYFLLEGYFFRGTLKDEIFTIKDVLIGTYPKSSDLVVDPFSLEKVIDKETRLSPLERRILVGNGVEYEN